MKIQLPLSNEFLISLTSTWEPDTLKIPWCWRPAEKMGDSGEKLINFLKILLISILKTKLWC